MKTKIVVCRKIPVTIRKHHVPGRWIVFGDSIGWTGPSFSSKAAAKRWALSIGYEVIP